MWGILIPSTHFFVKFNFNFNFWKGSKGINVVIFDQFFWNICSFLTWILKIIKLSILYLYIWNEVFQKEPKCLCVSKNSSVIIILSFHFNFCLEGTKYLFLFLWILYKGPNYCNKEYKNSQEEQNITVRHHIFAEHDLQYVICQDKIKNLYVRRKMLTNRIWI